MTKEEKVVFNRRLGLYKYLDMDDAIELALELAKNYLKTNFITSSTFMISGIKMFPLRHNLCISF